MTLPSHLSAFLSLATPTPGRGSAIGSAIGSALLLLGSGF